MRRNIAYRTFSSNRSSSSSVVKNTSSQNVQPQLVKVPTLPFLGSTITSFSGTPKMDPTKIYDNSRIMKQRFGEFYSYGIPGLGAGLQGIVHVITDPNEFLKLVRMEGSQPSGAVQQSWNIIEGMKHNHSVIIDSKTGDQGLLGQGERWKAQRTFFQNGLLDPSAAKSYIPCIVEAARLASKGAPKASELNQMNYFLNLCAFDMFSSVMFGELTRCAAEEASYDAFKSSNLSSNGTIGNDSDNGKGVADPNHAENIQFCKAAIKTFDLSNNIRPSLWEKFCCKVLGYKTPLFKEFLDEFSTVYEIGRKKIDTFEQRYYDQQLNKYERNSYMANALQRFDEQNPNGVTREEMKEMCLFGLFAGVDTTSAVVAWNLMHVALNPNVQETLYRELKLAIEQSKEGQLTAKVLEKKSVPYLHHVLQETYRLTPPASIYAIKRASHSSIDIHGETLPQNSIVLLEGKYNCPHVSGLGDDDTMTFRPERWSADEVLARKGTALEGMDHPLWRDNFGQGARRCPGSRVATNEILIFLAQLVLDYQIHPPPHIKALQDVTYTKTALFVPNIPQLEFISRTSS